MKNNTCKKKGTEAEHICQKYLLNQGYQLLDTNYHCAWGEIDIIAKDGNDLVFIEVKFRTHGNEDFAKNTVSWQKQRKLIKTALCYFAAHEEAETLFSRFDVIVIFPKQPDEYEIIHYKNAFQAEDTDFE